MGIKELIKILESQCDENGNDIGGMEFRVPQSERQRQNIVWENGDMVFEIKDIHLINQNTCNPLATFYLSAINNEE